MTDRDVAIVGGGPAGCSTALFTARYGLDTVVFDRGNSSIRQCAFVENYLGFPGGIDVETLYAASHAHVERLGGEVRAETVERVSRHEGGDLRVDTDAGEYGASRVVAASTYDVSSLEGVLGEHFESEGGETYLDPDLADARGGTPVEGLWLAGPTAGVESQIVVAVGHGARVGLDVVTDYRRREEGWWDAAADHTDWVIQQGRYAGEEWLAEIAAYHAADAPDDLDEDTARRRARELAEEQQNWQIAPGEVERRTERAHRRFAERLDDPALLAAADDDAIREYVDALDGTDA